MTPCTRKCHDCGNVAEHADNIAPEVCCEKCGSQDTRLVNNPIAPMSQNNNRKPIFVECKPCGERWKVATTPCSIDALAKLKSRCPNCEETKQIFLCPTDGENAVTQARDGRDVKPKGKAQ